MMSVVGDRWVDVASDQQRGGAPWLRRGDRRVERLLSLSVPIAVLAMAASLAGVLSDRTYAAETANWAAQARGQDVANLVLAYPALLVAAWLAKRGSLRAYLVWLGVLVYSAYSYLLYAGFLHFSGWFPFHVAVLGLSVFALVGGVAALEPDTVRGALSDRAPLRPTGTLLVVMGLLFAALWLAEIVPAILAGEPPPSAVTAGLVTNPVHLLDLALLLPAMVLTGVWLRRDLPIGAVLVVPILTFGVVMGSAVLAMFVSLALAGEVVELVPVVLMAAAALLKLGFLVWVLTHLAEAPEARTAR
jgi:hypothetical protein